MAISRTRPSRRHREGRAAEAAAGDSLLDLGPLPHFIGYILRRAQLQVFEEFIATFEPLGLRPAEFSALLLIQKNPGRKQSEIAAALGIRQPNLVGLIDQLDRRELVRRKRLLTDRRSHAVTLTAAGKRLASKALATQDRWEKSLIARLGRGEHKTLLELLAKLKVALPPRQGEAA